MTKLGIVFMPRSASLTVEVAKAAEDGGFWGLGVCDSPILYPELYPIITACLMNTERLKVGPNVTNPVTRHWTIHASSARTFEEMAPGRYFNGIATGDGAVHSVGLKPATAQDLADEIERIRGASPEATPMYVAGGGPKMAAVAGRAGDGLIIGTGADTTALANLRDRAQVARSDAGIEEPFETWGLILLNIVAKEQDIERAREEVKPITIAYARHAFDFTFEDKNVPEEFHSVMEERFPRYDFMQHARVTDVNDNARLFEGHPDIEDYILNRFAIVGTPEMCAERLEQVVSDSGIDGVWFPTVVPDPVRDVQLAAEAFAGMLP